MNYRCLVIGVLAAVLALFMSSIVRAAGATYWQLTFSYDQEQLTIIDAAPIPPMRKQVHTPGLIGAPMKIAYDVEWLDQQGVTLLSTQTQIPLGMRSTLADDGPCAVIIPEAGTFVVRLEGTAPAQQPRAVRLSRTGILGRAAGNMAVPAALVSPALELALPETGGLPKALDGPLSVEKIRHTGDDDNRLVLVVMGDGYTAANLSAGEFEAAAANLVAAFGLKGPWDILFEATNVYRIDVESNEEGADNDPYATYVDTYLHSSFWVNDIERLLALTGTGYSQAYDAANSLVGSGVWDIIFVLVNSTKYGGSGGGIAVSSVHSSASEIILHEHGHSFGGLADEYSTAYPGYPPGDGEPNVDFDFAGPGLKWSNWVEPGTPLPTPDNSSYSGVVGAFEGARYLTTGIYRPWYLCLMRSLGVDFGPICQQAQVIEFFNYVDFDDDLVPSAGLPQVIGPSGVTFAITPLPFPGITYEWRLAGEPLAGADGPELALTSQDLIGRGVVSSTLELTAGYPTPLVRDTDIAQVFAWPVTAVCDCGIPGDVTCDDAATPLDVSYLVNYVYLSRDALCPPPSCPAPIGDMDCGGGVTPVDVIYLVNLVYKSLDAVCDGCVQ
jgi:hypothetical protein